MKNIVGGIFYRPHKSQNEELDIYGNVIDWSDIRSYTHDPVKVNIPSADVSGYQKQYQYGDRSLNISNIETPTSSDSQDTPVVSSVGIIPTSGTTGSHKIESGVDVGEMQAFLDEAAKHGIYFRVTSGLRSGAKTSSGRRSWHSSGDAIDVTPLDGQTYEEITQKIRNTPALVDWMRSHGYGILDETTKEMLAKTGGTGAHWHIGKDQSAIAGLEKILA